jgi:hypothetical protein
MALSLLWNSLNISLDLLPASAGFLLGVPLTQKIEAVCFSEMSGSL